MRRVGQVRTMFRVPRVVWALLVFFAVSACESATSPTATRLTLAVPPNGAVSGVAFTVQPIVHLTDNGGRLASGAEATAVTARLANGTGTLVGTTTVMSVGGIATFAGLRINGVGSHRIVFEAPALGTVETLALGVTQLPASLALDVQPATAYSGRAIRTQPHVSIRDHAGLVIASSRAPIVASIHSGSGAIAGTTLVNAFDGVSKFTSVSIVGSGEHRLVFSLAGGPSVISDPMTVVPAPDLLAKDVSALANNACAIANDGTAYCWGPNNKGQLGRSHVELFPSRAMLPVFGVQRFERIAVGYLFACAIDIEQRVWCWGTEEHGEVGSTMAPLPVPTLLPSTIRFDRLMTGYTWACARALDGVVHCWGDNALGWLGVGNVLPRVGPAPVSTAQRFSELSDGYLIPCALNTAGQAYCWGWGVVLPTPVSSPEPFSELKMGVGGPCGRAPNGSWYCSGPDNVAVLDTLLSRFTTYSRGHDHVCALDAAGTAFCWGANEFGQLGIGTTQSNGIPQPVVGGHQFVQLTLGVQFGCGRTVAGTVYCWGRNNEGQVGDSTTINRLVPTKVIPP